MQLLDKIRKQFVTVPGQTLSSRKLYIFKQVIKTAGNCLNKIAAHDKT